MWFFFFFQAEDGIRDDLVTGVQTCALPIYLVNEALKNSRFHEAAQGVYQFFWGDFCDWYIEWVKPELLGAERERSEEHTSELQSPDHLVCRLLLEKKNINERTSPHTLYTLN